MIYTAIDTFYITEDQLDNSPSRRDGVDKATENTLRIYGCDLIQESGILLRLPQAVMATGQVLFHRFYCKKSFARFNVKRVAASCVWLASKLEESPRRARQVLLVFHRMECRRENLPIEHLDTSLKKYVDLKGDLVRTERHLLKEMGFICHVEHPHKFISNYLRVLETPELSQEAWNLANDSLRTTLCVRFKSEVVACGVVYAAARRFQVPLPEHPPWWKAFDADKSGIDEVCRVLAHLYSLPKAQYIPVCKDGRSFTTSNKSWDLSPQLPREESLSVPPGNDNITTPGGASAGANQEPGKDVQPGGASDKLNDLKKSDGESGSLPPTDGESREEPPSKLTSEHKTEASEERDRSRRDRDRSKEREKDRVKSRDCDRGRESDRERGRERERERERERQDTDRDRDKVKDRTHRMRDKGHGEKSKHHSSRDRDYHSSYSSREKDRRRHH